MNLSVAFFVVVFAFAIGSSESARFRVLERTHQLVRDDDSNRDERGNGASHVLLQRLMSTVKKSGMKGCLDEFNPSICKLAAKMTKVHHQPKPLITTTTTKAQMTTTTNSMMTTSDALINENEFQNALLFNEFRMPSHEQYVQFSSQLFSRGGISDKREAAMFLAQILFQTSGLRFKKELACVSDGCPSRYHKTLLANTSKDTRYFGRGYIQLAYDFNYKEASMDLFNDARLLENPDLVADEEQINWAVAFWYWKKKVGTIDGVKEGRFGVTTMALNGENECKGKFRNKARRRFKIYKNVLDAFDLDRSIANEHGCYN